MLDSDPVVARRWMIRPACVLMVGDREGVIFLLQNKVESVVSYILYTLAQKIYHNLVPCGLRL